jgi:ABC-type polysaccharide/polyol phosphate export permease
LFKTKVNGHNFSPFLNELVDILRLSQSLLYVSRTDLKARYKRSILGPLWIVISLGLGSVGLGLMWSVLWQMEIALLLPQITIGFLVWIFISSSITEGSDSIVVNAEIIKNIKIPVLYFCVLSFTKNITNFVHSWIIILFISLIFPPPISWVQLMVIPGLVVAIIDLFLLIALLAILSTRYRDLKPLINSLIPLLFFVSPVLFSLKQSSSLEWVLLLNPLTYIISIVRDPILGVLPEWHLYFGSVFFGIILFVLDYIIFNSRSQRIIFWV